MGDLVDDDGFDGAFGGLEFETELFFQDGEEGWVVRVGSFFGGPFDLEVEVAFETRVVIDGTACLAAQCGGDVSHGHLRGLHGGPGAAGVGAHVGFRARSAWLEAGAGFSGLDEFQPVDGGFFLLAMVPELEAVFEQRENKLLELRRSGHFGVIGCDGVDIEGLVADPVGRAGDALIVGAEGDTDEGTGSSGGGDKASAWEHLAV